VARLRRDAEIYLGLGRGGYTIEGDAVLFDIGRWDTLAIAAHEGWHQYTQATFKQALPAWLEEGLACYMEGHRWQRGEAKPTFAPWRNFERFGELREAHRDGDLFPLDEILSGVPQGFLKSGRSKLLTYYAQVWAVTQYLAEGEDGRYRKALEELLQDAAAGRISAKVAASPHRPPGRRRIDSGSLGKTLVMVYFNPDYAEFRAGYEAFIEEITRRGAGESVWRGQSPVIKAPAAVPAAPQAAPAGPAPRS
jgi:hypothetical protein